MHSTLKCSPDWEEYCERDNNILKIFISTRHDVRSTLKCSTNWVEFRKYANNVLGFIIPSSYNVCTTLKRPQHLNELYEEVHCEIEISKFTNLALHDTCENSPAYGGLCEIVYYKNDVSIFVLNHPCKWNGTTYASFCEYKRLESFLLWSEKYITFRIRKIKSQRCAFKIQMSTYLQQSYLYIYVFVLLILFEFNHHEHSFNRNYLKRYNDLAYWVCQCLCLVILFLYKWVFLLGMYMRRKIVKIGSKKQKTFIYQKKKKG